MKKRKLSKKEFLFKSYNLVSQLPIFLIIFFILGLLAGISIYKSINFYLIAVFLMISSFGFIFFKLKKYWVIVLCLGLGFLYGGLFQYLIFLPISDQCLSAGVLNVTERKNGQEVLVESNYNRAVLVVKDQNFQKGNKILFCFDRENIKEPYNLRYFISQNRTANYIEKPSISLISDKTNWLEAFSSFALKLKEKSKVIDPGDSGEFARGLILGGTNGFSEGFKKMLQDTGTSHLVAVSGFNISIITIFLFMLMRNLFSRRVAFASTIVTLIFFVLLTSMSASVVRAAIMGGLFIIGKAFGRKGNLLNLLFVAALLMLLINPYTMYDAGFQLSFLATFGLIISMDGFSKMISGYRISSFSKDVLSVFLSTIVAQVYTLPVLLLSFGRVSLIAPLVNLLILPLVPLAMIFSALAIAASLISPTLGIFFGIFASIFTRYFIWIIKLGSSLKYASFTIIPELAWLKITIFIMAYLLIFYLSFNLKYKNEE